MAALFCLSDMKDHAPYTPDDWHRDCELVKAGQTLACPDCDSNKNYEPKNCPPNTSPRHYRACKTCGFWQEADGTPAYRVWQSIHECRRPLASGETSFYCKYCGKTLTQSPGNEIVHLCGKYLMPEEPGYTCATCGHFYGRESEKLFRLRGSG